MRLKSEEAVVTTKRLTSLTLAERNWLGRASQKWAILCRVNGPRHRGKWLYDRWSKCDLVNHSHKQAEHHRQPLYGRYRPTLTGSTSKELQRICRIRVLLSVCPSWLLLTHQQDAGVAYSLTMLPIRDVIRLSNPHSDSQWSRFGFTWQIEWPFSGKRTTVTYYDVTVGITVICLCCFWCYFACCSASQPSCCLSAAVRPIAIYTALKWTVFMIRVRDRQTDGRTDAALLHALQWGSITIIVTVFSLCIGLYSVYIQYFCRSSRDIASLGRLTCWLNDVVELREHQNQ